MLFQKLRKKYDSAALVQYVDKKELFLPDCIFTKELSVFQSIVKYLKENLALKNNEIASLLYTNRQSVWQAYNKSKRLPKFSITPSKFPIPVSCFSSSLTTLEAIIVYLKGYLNYHEIGLLLKRNERTIWTVYQKAKKKYQDNDLLEFKLLFNAVKRRYKLSSLDLVRFLDEKEILIPDCIFTKNLSVFQSVVIYLKKNLHLKNNKIALLLHKSQKSIWQAYNKSKKLSSFRIVSSKYFIPVSCFTPSLTILESVVVYLKERWLLNYHQIGLLLKRDDRTIWTVYQRAKKKI